ncbi:MAG: hypothetical protein H0W18_18320 [Acidobacteria bacterium]|nr:hypothetical protein [Acidobacteriota bacterium]
MPEAASAPRAFDALTPNQLLEMYWFARLVREIEERLVILFRQSKVLGGLYRSLGQEGESVGTAYALRKTDALLPLIRNMGALMTIGVAHVPYSPPLESAFLPNADKVIEAAKTLVAY